MTTLSDALQTALDHHQNGRFQEASMLYQQILEAAPEFPDAHFHMGHLLQQTGKLHEAIAFYHQALALKPDLVEAYHNLGFASQNLDMNEEAITYYREALRLRPDLSATTINLGNIFQKLGRLDEASQLYERATTLDPGNASLLNNFSCVLREQQRYEEALTLCQKALLADSGLAEAHFNRGQLLQHQFQLAEAIVCYEEALRLKPALVDAYDCYGTALKTLGKTAEAAAMFRKALAVDPAHAPALNNLGLIFHEQFELDKAIDCFQQAMKTGSNHFRIALNLGDALLNKGDTQSALAAYETALSLNPCDDIRVKIATVLPRMYASAEEITAWRTRFATQIATLQEHPLKLSDPVSNIGTVGFFLSYQGLDNKILLQQLASLFIPLSLATPLPQREPRSKPKIGFVSRFWHAGHTISKLASGIVSQLSRENFEVLVFTVDYNGFQAEDAATRHISLPLNNLAMARERVLAEELDVLFYFDIGMDPLTYYLAFSRLAPVQCATWGHPDTTGIPTIDYFLSSTLLETEDAQSGYSEKLALLNSLPTYYQRPRLTNAPFTREHFGISALWHLYLCPQSLFKFHPDFDPLLADILRKDPAGMILLVNATYPEWGQQFLKRFGKRFPEMTHRIRILGKLDQQEFLNMMSLADVLLDTLHFGGGNSTYEALALGTPIITLPTPFMRGRVTAACYQKMGILDCIAITPEAYSDIAVNIATRPEIRESLKQRILAANQVLFEDISVIHELEKFFLQAIQAATGAPTTSEAQKTMETVLFRADNLYRQGRLEQALHNYELVLEANPTSIEALNNQGNVYQDMGRLEDAATCYARVIQLKPDLSIAYNNLALVRSKQQQHEEAIALFQQAISLSPGQIEAYDNLGHLLASLGQITEARDCYETSESLRPSGPLRRLRNETLCPPILQSQAEIQNLRQRIEAALDAVEESETKLTLPELFQSECRPSFYLPYHGQDDRPLKSRFAQIIQEAFPFEKYRLESPSPEVLSNNALPKIAFLVTKQHEHIFCKLMSGLLNQISTRHFEVYLLCFQRSLPLLTPSLENPEVHFLVLPETPEAAISAIQAQQFDLLHFFEVGTDMPNYLFPFFKLAKVQCTSWGFPETSGIPTMDYYISSSLLEPAEAQKEYSETLILLDTLPVYYSRPLPTPISLQREDFGIATGEQLYLCPQALFKFHPDFDPMLGDLLRQDPQGVIVMVNNHVPMWKDVLMKRFHQHLPDVVSRIRILDRMEWPIFMQLLSLADVMLDTLHFGGGNTTYEALALGTPIVTLPAPSMRGRVTAACYTKMGLTECIAQTPEAYLEIAFKLATNPQYRATISDKIKAANSVLFEDISAVRQLEAFYLKAIADAVSCKPLVSMFPGETSV